MCSQRVKKYAFSQLCLLTLKPGFHVIVAIILTQSDDRNRPDRTSLRGRTLKGKGAVEFRYEET